MLSRSALKSVEEKTKQAQAFIDAAEPKAAPNPVGRPAKIGEKREPVTISLTKTEVQQLDKIHKRLNFMYYSKNEEVSLDRSSLIRLIADKCENMSDEELWDWFK
ncbi:hypothetical protein [Vibrio cincinnatiensis]|uniref:hypothetical protein n=1 Tax=Vibrio cincinnatiensis TaxID=675 RepID=UPI001EDEC9DC|nr:hypothetical protein [Vibrio cincinnatiensis]MCG3741604.1 hypothetical protein [Vibrio cincinnatiensis]